MKPSDCQHLAVLVQTLWKRRGKFASLPVWDDNEVSIFVEQIGRVNISLEAAIAAVRQFKGTVEKFPNVAAVVKAIRQHEVRSEKGISPTEQEVDQVTAWRRRLGLDPQLSPSGVFTAVANRAVHTSMELYGHVYPALADELMRDCEQHAGWPKEVREDFCAWLLTLPSEPPVPETDWQADRLAHLRHRARCREVGKQPVLPAPKMRRSFVGSPRSQRTDVVETLREISG